LANVSAKSVYLSRKSYIAAKQSHKTIFNKRLDMQKNFTIQKFIASALLIAACWVATLPQASAQSKEPIAYSIQNIDFEVKILGNRRFQLNFVNTSNGLVYVRIYDVIGNLVKEEVVNSPGKFSKDYDMSAYKSEVYIIEVGNTKYSTTKRIFLN